MLNEGETRATTKGKEFKCEHAAQVSQASRRQKTFSSRLGL
jgi:hypothetical protein